MTAAPLWKIELACNAACSGAMCRETNAMRCGNTYIACMGLHLDNRLYASGYTDRALDDWAWGTRSWSQGR